MRGLNLQPPAGPLTAKLRGGQVLPKQQRENLNPVAMVLTGGPEDGALHFTLGEDRGCSQRRLRDHGI